jgi:hypothetical protein
MSFSNSLHFLLHLWSSPEAHIVSSKSENKDTQEEELGAMTQSTENKLKQGKSNPQAKAPFSLSPYGS